MKREAGKKKRALKPPREENFRKSFSNRFDSVLQHGDIGRFAVLLDVNPSTIWTWRQPGSALPEVTQIETIATSKNISPEWLAFGRAPRDPENAHKCFDLGVRFEQSPGLAEVLSAYEAATEDQRRAMLTLAPKPARIVPPPEVESKPMTFIERRGNVTAMHAEEAAPQYPQPLKNVTPRNERDLFPTFKILRRGDPRAQPFPKWFNIAAGPGRELRIAPEFLYLEKMEHARDVHSFIVSGDSMENTIYHNDTIAVQLLNGDAGFTLEPRDEHTPKGPLRILKQFIHDDDICIVSIDDDFPTLKRVRIHDEDDDWKLTIEADNQRAWNNGKALYVRRKQKLTVWAKFLGFANK